MTGVFVAINEMEFCYGYKCVVAVVSLADLATRVIAILVSCSYHARIIAITGDGSNQDLGWTQKPCIPLCLLTIYASHDHIPPY